MRAAARPDMTVGVRERGTDSAREAVARLFEEHGDKIFAFGLQSCRNPEDAHDLVQETFLRALKSWPSFQGRSTATTWLYTIAHRACIRLQRRRSGEPTPAQLSRLGTQAGEWLAVATGSSSLDDVLRQEEVQQVHRAVAELPAEFRFPLVLKEFADLSLEEIAQILGLKGATVKTRLHRGRLRVARALSDAAPGSDPEVRPGQTCLDLIEAKQAAMDKGLPFPVPDEELCALCHTVCRTLDSAHDACSALASVKLPPDRGSAISDSLESD